MAGINRHNAVVGGVRHREGHVSNKLAPSVGNRRGIEGGKSLHAMIQLLDREAFIFKARARSLLAFAVDMVS